MGIRKVKERTVMSLAEGEFRAIEHLRGCDPKTSCVLVGSEELTRVVPPWQRYAYDLMVHVGLQRYLDGKQRVEICEDLLRYKGIKISEATVSNLCDRFLIRIEMLHRLRTPYLRAALGGNWSLHIDATSDKGLGGLAIGMDGMRGWVLDAARIPSEAGEYIQPLVDDIVCVFGDPLATVRDMGKGMAQGVAELRKRGIPDLICHQHFLAAVGEKLLKTAHTRLNTMLCRCRLRGDLRELLRQLRPYAKGRSHDGHFGSGTVRKELLALVKWILDGDGKKVLRFPFALRHRDFVLRCQQAIPRWETWIPTPRTTPERRAVQRLGSLIRKIERDPRFAATLAEIEQSWCAFVELRGVLRLTHGEMLRQHDGIQQAEIAVVVHERMQSIERDVEEYTEQLRQQGTSPRPSALQNAPEAIILQYLEQYGAGLFGHPLVLDDDGVILFIVTRTNNPPEYFWGVSKRLLRRRLGRANLGRDMQQQPAQVAIALNLRFPDYVRVLCGSIDNLPDAFADLQQHDIPEGVLDRDHRDADLERVIRGLLSQEEVDQTTDLAAMGG